MKRYALLLLLLLAGCASIPAEKETVLFLCPYGGAKSVIAASYFNRLAEEQKLPYVAVAAAAEEPYAAVPGPVVQLLAKDGFDVRTFQPRHVAAEEVKNAAKIVSIDCDLARAGLGGVAVEEWNDVPKVSVDIDGSAAAIRRHVETLAAALRERRD